MFEIQRDRPEGLESRKHYSGVLTRLPHRPKHRFTISQTPSPSPPNPSADSSAAPWAGDYDEAVRDIIQAMQTAPDLAYLPCPHPR